MRVLSRTLVPGAAGSSIVASGITTLFTSWVMNHFCAVANGARTAVCRFAMSMGELYAPYGGVEFAWYIVCDSPRWCDPGAFANPEFEAAVGDNRIRPVVRRRVADQGCGARPQRGGDQRLEFLFVIEVVARAARHGHVAGAVLPHHLAAGQVRLRRARRRGI